MFFQELRFNLLFLNIIFVNLILSRGLNWRVYCSKIRFLYLILILIKNLVNWFFLILNIIRLKLIIVILL